MSAGFQVCFYLSVILVVAFLTAAILLKSRKFSGGKKRTVLSSYNIFLLGFFAASFAMAFPVFYYGQFAGNTGFNRVFKSVTISIVNSLQIFLLNADFTAVKETVANLDGLKGGMASAYTVYYSILYVVAPFLTFGFILSFFKDFLARLKYMLYPPADVYVFSEVNEQSLALAGDVLKNGGSGRKLLVFTDAQCGKDDNVKEELIEKAKSLGAVCLKKDATEIRLKKGKKHLLKFYFIGENEDKNLKSALELIKRCRGQKNYDDYNTQFYVFANSAESEVLLDSVDNGNMKVRRVTEYWNTILNTLRKYSIFKTALERDGKKVINLLVVGVGNYGAELIKTVCWLGQQPDYEVNIHAFDKFKAEDKLKTAAPELIAKNGDRTDGEPYYKIIFHDEKDVESNAFWDEIASVKDVTCAFVALGKDEMNIGTAIRLRTLFRRESTDPRITFPPIYTIVFNSTKAEIFARQDNLKKDYNIEVIDGVTSHYTLEVIERPALEEEGRKIHIGWAATGLEAAKFANEYEHCEYFRKSSVAASAHKAAMIDLGIYNLDEYGDVDDLITIYEHKRWNAYMRSEGFVYHNERCLAAKTHKKLVPFTELKEKDKEKDRRVKSAHKD